MTYVKEDTSPAIILIYPNHIYIFVKMWAKNANLRNLGLKIKFFGSVMNLSQWWQGILSKWCSGVVCMIPSVLNINKKYSDYLGKF